MGDNADLLMTNRIGHSDNDGVGDNADWAPNNASETVDSDSDGVGDNADAFQKIQKHGFRWQRCGR